MTHNKENYIFGIHAVQALLQLHPEHILQLTIHQERHDQKIETIIKLAKENNIPVEHISLATLDKLTHGENHQGVFAYCRHYIYYENDLQKLLTSIPSPLVLILDGIQDPHNLGACFRVADAAGVHAIIAPKDKSVGITAVVNKVASGAVAHVPFIQVTNLVRTIDLLKSLNFWIYGTDESANELLYDIKFAGAIALVMGSEGRGLRRLTREQCDHLIKIPMHGSVSSLNVSVAAGICLFEMVRQNLKK